MKEIYRKLLLCIFIQSPSLQMLYPGVPRTPWNRHKDMTKIAHFYGLETTREAFVRGIKNIAG